MSWERGLCFCGELRRKVRGARYCEAHAFDRREYQRQFADDRRRKAGIPRGQGKTLKELVGYQALHLRVRSSRGSPDACASCGSTDGRLEWASQTGDYYDVMDYEARCVPCHRAEDRRSPLHPIRKGAMPNERV